MEEETPEPDYICDIFRCDCAAQQFYDTYKHQLDKIIADQLKSQKEDGETSIRPVSLSERDMDIKDILDRILLLQHLYGSPSDVQSEVTDNTMSTDLILDYLKHLSIPREDYVGSEDYGLPPQQETGLLFIEELEGAGEEHEASVGYTKNVEGYLEAHKINETFRFLGAHLVATQPEFLVNLLDSCVKYRERLCDPPLLFQKHHIEALFLSMDPMRTGLINHNQYITGMKTLGTEEYDPHPPHDENGLIAQELFVVEALHALTYDLDKLLRVTGVSEISTPAWPTPCHTDSTLTTWIGDKDRRTPALVPSLNTVD